jgi:hypothetical protein
MIGMQRPGGRREARPVDLADRYVRRLTARGLVGLATGLLRMVERAYRAGYLDLPQVECCLRASAKLRRSAGGLIETKACDAPLGRPGTNPPRLVETDAARNCSRNITVIILAVACAESGARAATPILLFAISLFY